MNFSFALSLFQTSTFKLPLPGKGAQTQSSYIYILQRSSWICIEYNTGNMKYPAESYNFKITKDNSELNGPKRKQHNTVEQDECQKGV